MAGSECPFLEKRTKYRLYLPYHIYVFEKSKPIGVDIKKRRHVYWEPDLRYSQKSMKTIGLASVFVC